MTHSSPRRNSAVKARCSLVKLADKTPPYSSLSRTVPRADRFAVLYQIYKYLTNIPYQHFLTLKAKFFRALATPGFVSNLLPALTRTVTDEVGWLASVVATLSPALSTTVANERVAIRCAFRAVDSPAANIKNFVESKDVCVYQLFSDLLGFRIIPVSIPSEFRLPR